jgi:ABC-type multidrug transport system ATPase subunit
LGYMSALRRRPLATWQSGPFVGQVWQPTLAPVLHWSGSILDTAGIMKPLITVENLSKRYRGAEENAVEDVSFTVFPGELFALLGPNGAGKTTIVSILTTMLNPTLGTAVVSGHDVTKNVNAASRRSLWAYLQTVQKQSGTTIFLTTHYLEEAEKADSICILNHGKIVSYGTPSQLKADLTETFLLIDAHDRQHLQAELVQLNVSFVEDGGFKINLNGRDMQQLIKSIDTPLTTVKTDAPTLEEVYLAILEK